LPAFAGALIAVTFAACNASTSHIGSLTASTSADLSTPIGDIGPQDKIYAKATADNVASKITLNWELDAVNVKGLSAGPIAAANKSFDLDSDGSSTYNLTAPSHGWPVGTWKIVCTMMDAGTQRDQKSVTFTVGGGGASSDSSGSGSSSDSSATNSGGSDSTSQ
jgi:hypothetical protein